MAAAGLPDFAPVQNNVSYNVRRGTTRGFHAEPWDKYVSVAAGKVFGAWVDLRAGDTYGTMFTAEVDTSRAVFVPRGVANAFQTLEPYTVYTYLVNDLYSPHADYVSVSLFDQAIHIEWPIPLDAATISAKDRAQAPLSSIKPLQTKKILVLGGDGQLGRSLRNEYANEPNVDFAGREDVDITSSDLESCLDWRSYDYVINAAAFTSVDEAESGQGRETAWEVNVTAVSRLAKIVAQNMATLIHVSSDYIFDGSKDQPYDEADSPSPVNVYGQTKAAGEHVVQMVPRHYIVRTSWVIGDGHNFVRTMLSLGAQGVEPSVVADQHGRLTFSNELARAIKYLINVQPPYGTYNITQDGPVFSWAEIARQVFAIAGYSHLTVKGISAADFASSASGPVARRPANSALSLHKIRRAGFLPKDGTELLTDYVAQLVSVDR